MSNYVEELSPYKTLIVKGAQLMDLEDLDSVVDGAVLLGEGFTGIANKIKEFKAVATSAELPQILAAFLQDPDVDAMGESE